MWCKKWKRHWCIDCQSDKLPHQGRGWCQRCYSRNIKRLKSGFHPHTWSKEHDSCKGCLTITRKHQAKGLCKRCYDCEYLRKKTNHKPPAKSGWSLRYENCTKCKTQYHLYVSRGMCTHCYSKYRYSKPEYLKYKRDYSRNRSKTDINYRLTQNLRSRLRYALKNYQKKGKTLEYLGCSIENLKTHLEKQFQPGMTWRNYGKYGWHIDHIIPLAKFDLTNEKNIKEACNFKNLQPLWAEENWSKQDKTSSECQDTKGI